MPPSKAKWESSANFLLFLKKFKILTCWVLFDVHVNKFNGYQGIIPVLGNSCTTLRSGKARPANSPGMAAVQM
jgi:hypothetical protein